MRGYSFFGCQQFSIFIFASDGSLSLIITSLKKMVLIYKEVARDWLNDPLATFNKD
jgi:hypothetical protein